MCQQRTYAVQRRSPYSITSSARPSSKGGRLNPIALAVLRLTISRNRVGSSAGRSDGFLPFKILSTKVAHSRYSASWLFRANNGLLHCKKVAKAYSVADPLGAVVAIEALYPRAFNQN